MAETDYICKDCGNAFDPGRRRNSVYCSRACASGHSDQWRIGIYAQCRAKPVQYSHVAFCACKQCGKRWVARKRATSLCSDECRSEYARSSAIVRGRSAHVIQHCACKGCGAEFTLTYGDRRRKFCSQACSDVLHNPPGSRFIKKRYGVSVKEWARIRLMVFRRDSYLCHLCGGATDPSGDVNSDLYPNADHVVPVSKGGQTVIDNLSCSHRACNIKKSDEFVAVTY